jgi:hypothetical protein
MEFSGIGLQIKQQRFNTGFSRLDVFEMVVPDNPDSAGIRVFD